MWYFAGINIDGFLAGKSSPLGLIKVQAKGDGIMDNQKHSLSQNFIGSGGGAGGSSLTGANHVKSAINGNEKCIVFYFNKNFDAI